MPNLRSRVKLESVPGEISPRGPVAETAVASKDPGRKTRGSVQAVADTATP